jgi:nucleotide-binding universal stress UspA family protein
MTIKRILVPLPGSAEFSAEIDLALTVAKAMGAHVEALFIAQPPPSPRGAFSVGDIYSAHGSAALAPLSPFAEERERQAREAREQFVVACASNGVPMLEDNKEFDALPSASWREREGSYVDVASQRATAFDLIIAASASATESLKDIAEQSLLQSRRPVLLAPSRLDTKLTDPAMIAWDESPECWHAVSAAVPLLKLAQSVWVVSVDKKEENRRGSQAEALAYLRCHGLKATAKVIAPDLRSVGDTLLATAAEQDTGLLVMGAYSHNRLREMLLGGATRDILQHASSRPVLLAH